MTIKTKLIANVIVIAVIIAAISMASFLSMRFLLNKFSYLTEKSTPFQLLTIELQREMQECISSLVKVNAAHNSSEYTQFREAAEKSLTSVENSQSALRKIAGNSNELNVSFELDTIALDLFTASEDRINSTDASATANAKVQLSMKESTDRLNDLDSYVGNLQSNFSKAYAAALETSAALAVRLQRIEELRNLIREMQLLTINVQNAKSGSTVLIARGKLKALTARIFQNEYFSSNKAIAATTSQFIDNLTEYIKLQTSVLSGKDNDSINKTTLSGQDILFKLNDLFQTLDQETMLARDELTMANGRQKEIFTQSNIANDLQVENSHLLLLGLSVTAEANRLLTVGSIKELDKLDADIRSQFQNIHEHEKKLDSSLKNLNAVEELKILRVASAALASVRASMFSSEGIIATLKKKLHAIEKADRSAGNLTEIVARQTAKGREAAANARSDQDKSVEAVNSVIMKSRFQIMGIGFVAIIIGSLFGFWIYRSVLNPLRLVLGAVQTQQKQVQEKALLAEAVAGGDLTRSVTISKALELDQDQINNDEMGMVLNAVVGMSEAQVTLDRSFAEMTASLSSSRNEEIRRDHLKSGLYELNIILRIEQKTSEMADKSLAFIAVFLDAGVGVLYQYSENTVTLSVLSTYAISDSKRINQKFGIGEGLVGQVARERKAICLDTVPPDYLPISSALGVSNPATVVVLPLLHNDILVGVLELGSFKRFDEDDFVFLNQALEGLAIAININNSRRMVNDLLEQARQQSEELQQTNEEMVEYSRMLAEQQNVRIS
jgi:methyl-accepting chemotaxis protein